MKDPEPRLERIGPIVLAPGKTRRDAISYLLFALCAVSANSFMSAIQPYVFNEMLHIDPKVQGQLSGNLAAFQQVAVLILVPILGAWSDSVGRRVLLILSISGMLIGLLTYPLVAAIPALFLIRFLFGAATTAHTAAGPALLMDLPANSSRGKFLSFSIIVQSSFVALIVSFAGMRMPGWLQDAGYDAVAAGRLTFWYIVIICIAGLCFAVFGMRSDRPLNAPKLSLKRIATNMGEVIAYARINRRFRIVMIVGFVLRADMAVTTTFLSLWVVSSARDAGIPPTQAMAFFGNLQIASSFLHVILPIFAGLIADRVNRLGMLIASLGFGALAYASSALVHDTTGWAMFGVIALISLGDAASGVASHSLLGQESPPHLRGSAYGLFALLGTASVILVSLVSGYAFDAFGYNAPFMLLAGLSVLFMLWALWVVRKPDTSLPLAVAQ